MCYVSNIMGKDAQCHVSLVIKEKQIKTTIRYCFTPTWMAIVRKMDNSTCW